VTSWVIWTPSVLTIIPSIRISAWVICTSRSLFDKCDLRALNIENDIFGLGKLSAKDNCVAQLQLNRNLLSQDLTVLSLRFLVVGDVE
jgi:hypothetical protein